MKTGFSLNNLLGLKGTDDERERERERQRETERETERENILVLILVPRMLMFSFLFNFHLSVKERLQKLFQVGVTLNYLVWLLYIKSVKMMSQNFLHLKTYNISI